jgi:CBS domain-containing protein
MSRRAGRGKPLLVLDRASLPARLDGCRGSCGVSRSPPVTPRDGSKGAKMKIEEILRRKGSRVITIKPEQSLREAVEKLADQGVGSLLVVDDAGAIAGILSERDVLRTAAKLKEKAFEVPISDVMTRSLIIGFVEDSVESVMGLMTEKRIRHLPVMSKGHLAGIISIGDVVKAMHHEASVTVRYLEDYIAGKYPN